MAEKVLIIVASLVIIGMVVLAQLLYLRYRIHSPRLRMKKWIEESESKERQRALFGRNVKVR